MDDFALRLIDWQRCHGRHDLPWQQSADPYRTWLSEIMLQQTQVSAVIPYFERFVARFPDVQTLAAATLAEVLSLWAGLGYYSRARNLHAAAVQVMERHQGQFPSDPHMLSTLPGIGRSTAAAIAALSFGRRATILDGNVKRVLIRHQALLAPANDARQLDVLWQLAEQRTPERDVATYTQAMMDLGATVCRRRRPLCHACPLAGDCLSLQRGLTDLLPIPASRKPPTVVNMWLVACTAGKQVWLQRRPARGIWSGLWSLPEFDRMPDADVLDRLTGGKLLSVRTGDAFRHQLTHRDLHITPVLADFAALAQPDAGWMTVTQAIDAGVPVPVRRILEGLASAG